MNLLLIDEDLHFGRILSSALASEGVAVSVESDPERALASARAKPPDCVVVAVDSALPASVALLGRLRALESTRAATIFVLAGRDDAVVRGAAAAAAVAQVFVRPLSVLDLAVAIRGARAAPAPKAVQAAIGGRLDLDNTTRILRLWARRANGVLQIGTHPSTTWVTLADGGPVDPSAESALRAVLHGGELEFQPLDVDGEGDERAMALWLWQEAEAGEGGREAPPSRATVVIPTRLTESAGRLPLPAALARVVAGLVGPVSLGRLCEGQNTDPAEVNVGLATLATLGIVTLQAAPNTPLAPAPPPRPAPPAPPRDVLAPVSQARTHSGRVEQPPSDPFARPAPSGSRSVGDPFGDPFASRPPSSGQRPAGDPFAPLRTRAPDPLPPVPPPAPPPSRPVVPLPPAPRPVPPAPPRLPTGTRSGGDTRSVNESRPVAGRPAFQPQAPRPAIAAPPLQPASVGEAAAVVRRLRREVDLLRASDPWTVLSVPHKAERAVVEAAGARMRTRYGDLARANTGEIHDLASQILARVEEACAILAAEAAPPARAEQPGDDAFYAGQKAMAAGDWATADRRFIAARDQNLDSARNLAHVGWARVHNPEMPAAERTSDGLDLLLLAEQLDPQYADGQYFLAMVLHRRGDDDAARRRIARALRAEPGHVAANALARKLRRPGTP